MSLQSRQHRRDPVPNRVWKHPRLSSLRVNLRLDCRPLFSPPSPKTVPNSINRAFADDIATIVQSLQDLSTLKDIFDLFKDISGLDLKMKKCSLFPRGIDPTPDWSKRISKSIKQIVPEWSKFSVVPSAEYLGFMIGPKGISSVSGEKTLNEYVERSNLIANASLAPSIGATFTSNESPPLWDTLLKSPTPRRKT